MYYNKVEISGVNTAKLKVLKESEKTELLRQMRSGDPTAREKLINGNLRLVLSVIQRFSGRGENPGSFCPDRNGTEARASGRMGNQGHYLSCSRFFRGRKAKNCRTNRTVRFAVQTKNHSPKLSRHPPPGKICNPRTKDAANRRNLPPFRRTGNQPASGAAAVFLSPEPG